MPATTTQAAPKPRTRMARNLRPADPIKRARALRKALLAKMDPQRAALVELRCALSPIAGIDPEESRLAANDPRTHAAWLDRHGKMEERVQAALKTVRLSGYDAPLVWRAVRTGPEVKTSLQATGDGGHKLVHTWSNPRYYPVR
jgi:hypothetical protein